MSIESKNEEDPTLKELLDLETKTDLLGRGDLVHKIKSNITMLGWIIEEATNSGWTDEKRTRFKRGIAKINEWITQVKLEQAREKGLL